MMATELKQEAAEQLDHYTLRCLLQEWKSSPGFCDFGMRKQEGLTSPLAEDIRKILLKHPEYAKEFLSLIGGNIIPSGVDANDLALIRKVCS